MPNTSGCAERHGTFARVRCSGFLNLIALTGRYLNHEAVTAIERLHGTL
jgi:hypothetical protein